MRLYAIAAVLLLAASIFVRATLRDDPGPILTVADVLFWVSGVVLVLLAAITLGRYLGLLGRSGDEAA